MCFTSSPDIPEVPAAPPEPKEEKQKIRRKYGVNEEIVRKLAKTRQGTVATSPLGIPGPATVGKPSLRAFLG